MHTSKASAHPTPIRIRDASRDDNAALLALTAASAMGGRIAVRVDREPDFFRLIERRGPGVLLVAEHAGAIVGSLSASVMSVYVEGREDRLLFLGDFKVAPAYRGSTLAVRLIRAMHQRVRHLGVDLLLGLTARGNQYVEPFQGGRAGLPRTVPLGTFRVLQMIPLVSEPRRGGYAVREEPATDELLALYVGWAARRQFAPVVAPGALAGTRHLVARSPGGKIVSAMALVDVSDARQNVLIRLPWVLRMAASGLRGASRVLPIVPPPTVGGAVRTLYIRAVGIADGHAHGLTEVLRQARFVAGRDGCHFLSIGLHERDDLNGMFRRVPAFTFEASGFLVHLRGEDASQGRLLDRIPYQDFSLG